MKIGIIRHFKVNHPYPKKKLLSHKEICEWFDQYEWAAIHLQCLEINSYEWDFCYSSPQARAIRTAKHVYRGKIALRTELKELNILHQLPKKIRLPFLVWGTIIRFHSTKRNPVYIEFQDRIRNLIDEITSKNQNVLLVSHWFVIKCIEKELKTRGFIGAEIRYNDYGKLMEFIKVDSCSI